MEICSYSEILYSRDNKKSGSKIRKKMSKKIKKSNIIYVVVKPQPGQVKGDWAVRDHKKIYSHHRIKLNAIKKARSLAKKINATVMIQKTDGTFSKGYKTKLNN